MFFFFFGFVGGGFFYLFFVYGVWFRTCAILRVDVCSLFVVVVLNVHFTVLVGVFLDPMCLVLCLGVGVLV